jgi:hypothetical protein
VLGDQHPAGDVRVGADLLLDVVLLVGGQAGRRVAVVEDPQRPIPGLARGQPAHVAERVVWPAGVEHRRLDSLRPPPEHFLDGAVLVDAGDKLVAQGQAVLERLLLVGGLVADLALVGLVQGAQVRVQHLEER